MFLLLLIPSFLLFPFETPILPFPFAFLLPPCFFSFFALSLSICRPLLLSVMWFSCLSSFLITFSLSISLKSLACDFYSCSQRLWKCASSPRHHCCLRWKLRAE